MIDQYQKHAPKLAYRNRYTESTNPATGSVHDPNDYPALQEALRIVKQAGIKTCLYSGQDSLSQELVQLLPSLDYLKLGAYKHELGGLSSKATNQRFYAIHNGKLIDKTYLFTGSQPNIHSSTPATQHSQSSGVEQIHNRKKDERCARNN